MVEPTKDIQNKTEQQTTKTGATISDTVTAADQEKKKQKVKELLQ